MTHRSYGVPRSNPPPGQREVVPARSWSASAIFAAVAVVLLMVATLIYNVSKTVAVLVVNTTTSTPHGVGEGPAR